MLAQQRVHLCSIPRLEKSLLGYSASEATAVGWHGEIRAGTVQTE